MPARHRDPLAGSFVAIPRASDGVARAALEQALETSPLPAGAVKPGESFYLAIAKSELEKRWFLSAYLTQLFPETALRPIHSGRGWSASRFRTTSSSSSMWTTERRAVTRPTRRSSSRPTRSVKGWLPFSRLPNASQYILIDPSAGLNRFGVVADAFSSTSKSDHFEVDLSFTQAPLADGVTYEQVFTGSSEAPSTHGEGIEPSAYRLSGTIGLALRRYSEGTDYDPPACQRWSITSART